MNFLLIKSIYKLDFFDHQDIQLELKQMVLYFLVNQKFLYISSYYLQWFDTPSQTAPSSSSTASNRRFSAAAPISCCQAEGTLKSSLLATRYKSNC